MYAVESLGDLLFLDLPESISWTATVQRTHSVNIYSQIQLHQKLLKDIQTL